MIVRVHSYGKTDTKIRINNSEGINISELENTTLNLNKSDVIVYGNSLGKKYNISLKNYDTDLDIYFICHEIKLSTHINAVIVKYETQIELQNIEKYYNPLPLRKTKTF